MKPDQLYQELKDLAERLQITVAEHNLKTAGIRVKSGLCTVKGRKLFILDKHKSIDEKIRILAEQLATIPHDHLYVMPAVRDLLDKHAFK